MSRLWMFYPENDVALATNTARFTPPKNALLLRRRGGFVMNWMAEEGDLTIYETIDPDYEKKLSDTFRLSGERYTPLCNARITSLMPWGWSSAAMQTMLCWGVEPRLMPSKERLMRIRDLSHRRISIAVNNRLAELGLPSITDVQELTTEKDIDAALSQYERRIFKAPWSSSGRGIIDSSQLSHNELKRRLLGIINKQGSVMSEPYLDCARNFAMLFSIKDLICKFIGLSLFNNARGSSYEGNIVAPQPHLEAMLSEHINMKIINDIRIALEKILTDLVGQDYEAYCGVDMMIYRDRSGNYALAPCIEVNLRMTMGVIALQLAKNHLHSGSIGSMTIRIGNYDGKLTDAEVIDGKLVSGEIDMVAPNPQFNFIFSATRAE